MTATASGHALHPGLGRRVSAFLHRHGRVRLGLLLAPPLGWLVVAYLGSLAVMLVSSLYRVDPFTGKIVTEPGLQNYQTILTSEVYRIVTLRTVGIAAAVTVTDALIAFPIAY
jgi:putative spermidine/putrescine transport system permease protein